MSSEAERIAELETELHNAQVDRGIARARAEVLERENAALREVVAVAREIGEMHSGREDGCDGCALNLALARLDANAKSETKEGAHE